MVTAPYLRVTAFDGRTVTLGAFRGRPVVDGEIEEHTLRGWLDQVLREPA